MNQFDFTGKMKTSLLAMIGVGVLSILIALFTVDHVGLRIWSNVLHNSVFFTGISFITLFLLCAKSLAYSGWQVQFKRLWEAITFFLPIGIGLFLLIIVGMFAGWHHMYEWAVPEVVADDELLQYKSGLLNMTSYIIASVGVVGVWFLFAWIYRRNSLSEDKHGGLQWFNKTKVLSGLFLPIGGFSSAFVVWLWVMSVDPHWYSTLFAWYNAASWLVASIAFTIIMLLWLKARGYYKGVNDNHFHDLGKYLFGFSIFWTYLWFSQFMLIWYANVGEETVYFRERYDNYPFLFTANVVINFAVPFFILMRNSTKRKVGTLVFTAAIVFLGHWLDFFLMIKPGVYSADQHIEHVLHGGAEDHNVVKGTTHLSDHIDSNDDHSADTHDEAAHSEETHTEGTHDEAETHSAEGDHSAESTTDAHEGEMHTADSHSEEMHTEETHSTAESHSDESHADAGHSDESHAGAEHGDDHGAHASAFKWGYTLPGFLEFGMLIGFLGLFLYVVLSVFSRSPIIPKNDPYLDESEHHEVVFNDN